MQSLNSTITRFIIGLKRYTDPIDQTNMKKFQVEIN